MEKALLEAIPLLSLGIQLSGLWVLADFFTGIIHWWEDTYGNPSWPIIGKHIIKPNLDHHRNPRLLLKGSYWNRINTSVYAACVIILLCWLCGWHSWRMIVCVLFCSQGNEIHAMGHRSDAENGSIICFLQRMGIIQRRKTHGWHHKAPYDTNFCVMTEFVNPLLNVLGFWNGLEWCVRKLFRISVLRGSATREGI